MSPLLRKQSSSAPCASAALHDPVVPHTIRPYLQELGQDLNLELNMDTAGPFRAPQQVARSLTPAAADTRLAHELWRVSGGREDGRAVIEFLVVPGVLF